jgi:peptidoglycan hydrolase-like protein with peptidoglycan-binding domain
MNIKTKIVAAFTLAVLVAPGISMAQTMSVAQLQAEIASLTAQLTQLESQLAASGGSTAVWCYTFNNSLSIGMSGAAVTALQTALQKDGESITVSGTFDDQTAAAVTGFQEKYASTILAPYGLTNGTGYAGKGTRTELNSLFGCTGSNPVTPPIAVPPITPTPVPVTTNPVTVAPTVTGVTSAGATLTPGTAAFVLGTNFDQGSIIVIDGAQVPTTYISSQSLQFVLPAGTNLGSHTASVTEKAGANSNQITFQVVAAYQAPTVTPSVTVGYPTTGSALTIGQTYNLTWYGYASPSATFSIGLGDVSGKGGAFKTGVPLGSYCNQKDSGYYTCSYPWTASAFGNETSNLQISVWVDNTPVGPSGMSGTFTVATP